MPPGTRPAGPALPGRSGLRAWAGAFSLADHLLKEVQPCLSSTHCAASAAPLPSFLAPGVVDENAAHRFGRGGEEVSAAVPVLDLVHVHQPEVRLMDQGGGLEGLAGPFPRQF